MTTTGYWAAIDAALVKLKTAKTPEEVIAIMGGDASNIDEYGDRLGCRDAFWGGDGDDVLGAS